MKILTLQQTAKKLKLCERTVRDLARAGKIAGSAKVGHSWRFDEQQLMSVFASGGGSIATSESEPQEAA